MKQLYFSENLKALRKKRGLTQKQLADFFSIGQTAIANYEMEKRFPDPHYLAALADYFNISLDMMLNIKITDSDFSEEERIHFKQKLVELFQQSDFHQIRKTADELLMRQWSLLSIFDEILIPLLKETGKRWNSGEIRIYEEHLISSGAELLIDYLVSRISRKEETSQVFIGFIPLAEKHQLGMKMVCGVLYEKGWKTYFLGNFIPDFEVLQSIKDLNADVCGISFSDGRYADSVISSAELITRHFDIPVLIGGAGVNERSLPKPFIKGPSSMNDILSLINSLSDV